MFVRRAVASASAAVLAAALVVPGTATHAAANRTLTIEVTGRGEAPASADVTFIDPRTGRKKYVRVSSEEPGSKRVSLPEQTYDVFATVFQREQPHDKYADRTMMFRSFRLAGGHDRLALDARLGKPVDVQVDEPTADGFIETEVECICSSYRYRDGVYTQVGRLFVVPASKRGLSFHQFSTWRKAGSTPDKPSPYTIHLESGHKGGLPDGVTQHVRKADLANVRVTYRRAAGVTKGQVTWGSDFARPELGTELNLPATVTEYLMPGRDYSPWVHLNGFKLGYFDQQVRLDTLSRRYARGRAADQTLNMAVASPRAFGQQWNPGRVEITSMPWFFTADGMYQFERLSGTMTVRLGRRVLARSKLMTGLTFRATDLRKRHRLTLTAQRPGTGRLLSDRATVDWWFTPGRSKVRQQLPLLSVQMVGRGLDDKNTARPGSTVAFPVLVQRVNGAPVARITKVTVEVSFDGGRTWRRARLTAGQGRWTATIRHPAAGAVALRTSAVDATGDSVRQTIYRAYMISP